MKTALFVFSACFVLCLAGKTPIIVNCQHETCSKESEQKVSVELTDLSELNNDFESGLLQPWIEESQGNVQWKVDKQGSSWEPSNPAPQLPNGKNYLRIDRGASPSFSIAILRSPTFKLTSSETYISFSFWIRSKWPDFTNLELYLAQNGNEESRLNLHNYSDISNRAWQSQSVLITGAPSSDFSLVFYAYCGIDAEDAVAIDDIRFSSFQESTTSTVSGSTTDGPVTEPTTKLTTKPTTETTTEPNTELNTESTTESTAESITVESTAESTTESITESITESTEPTTTTTSSVATTSTTPVTETTPAAIGCPTEPDDKSMNLDSSFNCPNNTELRYPATDEPCNTEYYECTNCIATLKNCVNKKIFNSQLQDCQPCSQVPACTECRN